MNERTAQPPVLAPIRGDIIRWVRQQRALNMRTVHDRGGPTPAYQSAVETGVKTDVSGNMLKRWLAVLDVSEPFVRGAYPRYHQEPWAVNVLPAGAVAAARALLLNPLWEAKGAAERARDTLRALANAGGLTPTILAYMLDVDVVIIHEWLAEQRDIPKDQVEAMAALTQLSEKEILNGLSPQQLLDAYGSTMVRAFQQGISAETLNRLLDGLAQ